MISAEHLWRRAHTLRLGLSQRLDEIYVSEYPTPHPQDLIEFIQAFLTKLGELIDNKKHPSHLPWIINTLEEYGTFLSDLDNASTDQTPRALVLILQDLSDQLFSKSILIASPQEEYNYSIWNVFPYLKNTTSNLSDSDQNKLLKKFPSLLNIITFPRIERDNIFVHAIFGHELGHPIADEFLSNEEQNDSYQQDLDKARRKILSLVSDSHNKSDQNKTKKPIDLLKEIKPYVDELLRIRRRGLEELISDCISVFLFGPSALFAAYDIFLADNLDKQPSDPDNYPPNRYRLRVMKTLIDDEKYTDALLNIKEINNIRGVRKGVQSVLEEINRITNETDDKKSLEDDQVVDIAYKWIEKSLSDAIKFAKKRVEKVIYQSENIRNEIPELIQRISFGIPPNENGVYPNTVTVDWRSAITAGWIYRFAGFPIPNNHNRQVDSQDIDRLQRITLRAIEYIMLNND